MKNCYALFIGIDHYTGDVPNLNGCQLDADRMQKYIAQHLNTDHYQLHSQLLVSEGEIPPTRHHIIEQIKVHLGQAKKGDYVLFFYAGHGSTEKAPAYFGETDDNFQTLVPQDARTKNPTTGLPIKNILDKELRYLFHQIWKEEQPQLIYIQDSCHSTGSNRLAEHQKHVQEVFTQTTALQQEHTLTEANQEIGLPIARYTMPTTDEKLLNQWEENDSEQLQGLYTGFDATIMPLLLNNIQTPLIAPADLLPLATQVHLAACGKHEYAYEVSPSGGVFTNTLLKVLHANGNNISYQQLLQRIKLSIGGAFEQSPSLFINDVDSTKIHQPFLGDLLRKKTSSNTTVGTDIFKGFFPVGYNKVRGWHISASEILSLPRLSSQTIQQIPIEIFYQNSKPKGKANASITQVNPQYSAFQFTATGQPPAVDDADKLVAMIPPQYTRRWRAKVAIDPSIPLSIFEDTFETKQLAKTMATGGRRKLMWVENLSQADYYVEQQGQWLALYAQTTNELILRASDAIYLADETEWVVTEKTAPSWQRWQNNTYTPIEDQTQLRIQDLPERASIALLRILLDLFDRTNPTTSLKIGYKLPTSNQNSLEQFLEEEKRTATYFNHFINWKSFEEADYVVETGIDGWEVYPIESEEINPLPLFAKTAGFSKKAAFNLLSNLQKLTKWLTVQKLYNGLQTKKLGSLPLELKFTFYKDKQRTQSTTKIVSLAEKGSFDDYEKGSLNPLELIENEPLRFVAGEPNFLQFDLDIQLGNYSLPIFYATLLLNDNYGIQPLQQDLGCHLLPPNQTALLPAIKINQPSQMRLFSASQSKAVYYLKLFVGFQRFDISGLLQEPLPPPTPPNRIRATKKQYRGYQIQTPSTGEQPGMWASFVIPIIVK